MPESRAFLLPEFVNQQAKHKVQSMLTGLPQLETTGDKTIHHSIIHRPHHGMLNIEQEHQRVHKQLLLKYILKEGQSKHCLLHLEKCVNCDFITDREMNSARDDLY